MKVGILTTHDEINHGAYLQAFALQQTLNNLGCYSLLINYKSFNYLFAEYKIYICQKNPVNIIKNLFKISKFKKSLKLLNCTRHHFTARSVNQEGFDLIVLGSDEIWNYSNCIGEAMPLHFADGLQAKKIISYAPSFGNVVCSDVFPGYVERGLRRLCAVSVRDRNSFDIVTNKLKLPCTLVLDPTFLISFDKYLVSPKYSNFILIYGFFSADLQKEITRFAIKENLITISVGYINKWCDKNIVAVSPFEWVGYISASKYVVTSMYHGTIFSLKYKKQFCTYVTPYRRNKLETIAEIFGVSDRMITDETFSSLSDILKNRIEYLPIDQIIDVWKSKSINFLKDAIYDTRSCEENNT